MHTGQKSRALKVFFSQKLLIGGPWLEKLTLQWKTLIKFKNIDVEKEVICKDVKKILKNILVFTRYKRYFGI